jgi:SanA protein
VKPPPKAAWKVWLRRIFLGGFTVVMLAVAFVAWTNFAAYLAADGKLHDRVADVPGGSVGLVFGCPAQSQGGENPFFRARIDAAAGLWKAGKLRYLIVSGDNRDHYYNEPEKMRVALMKCGVPSEKIVCDYAGLRTLDSVVRAKEIFGVTNVVFISQRFQNQRAAYIAQSYGMQFCGFNAPDVGGRSGLKVKAREVLARAKMWLDVKVLNTRPTYLGSPGDLSTGQPPAAMSTISTCEPSVTGVEG